MKKMFRGDLSAELQEYIRDNNRSLQITEKEALKRNAIPVSREFTFEHRIVNMYSQKYSFFGQCSLTIEEAFSHMIVEYNIVGFTPYKVTQLPTTFGIKFKIDTLVVQAEKKKRKRA